MFQNDMNTTTATTATAKMATQFSLHEEARIWPTKSM